MKLVMVGIFFAAMAAPALGGDSLATPATTLAPAPAALAVVLEPLSDGEGLTWLFSSPGVDEGATTSQLGLAGQGCSVQSCNPGCLWCRTACGGYCTIFGGICQCQ